MIEARAILALKGPMTRLITAILVAAGRGTRAGDGPPKQYRPLGGVAVLRRSVNALLAHKRVALVQVVIHPDDLSLYNDAMRGAGPRVLPPVYGGETRAKSVQHGLRALAPHGPDDVLIHDAARPFLSLAVIDGVLAGLQTHAGAFPALPVVDALWHGDHGLAKAPQDRTGLFRAQTPQGFDFSTIVQAHESGGIDAPDDVTLTHGLGIDVAITQGDPANYKLTTAADFTRASKELQMDVRTGNGFDVHAFEPGDHVTLCGVRIQHNQRLKGHSDADVAMHAITDALFGALAEGDIGQWFPPSDPQWKGAASEIFLQKAVERVAERGFTLTHIDCTIICEQPKIGPHAADMRARIAHLSGIDPGRVSVKATTSERLGFTGRSEGIAATATATLVKS